MFNQVLILFLNQFIVLLLTKNLSQFHDFLLFYYEYISYTFLEMIELTEGKIASSIFLMSLIHLFFYCLFLVFSRTLLSPQLHFQKPNIIVISLLYDYIPADQCLSLIDLILLIFYIFQLLQLLFAKIIVCVSLFVLYECSGDKYYLFDLNSFLEIKISLQISS